MFLIFFDYFVYSAKWICQVCIYKPNNPTILFLFFLCFHELHFQLLSIYPPRADLPSASWFTLRELIERLAGVISTRPPHDRSALLKSWFQCCLWLSLSHVSNVNCSVEFNVKQSSLYGSFALYMYLFFSSFTIFNESHPNEGLSHDGFKTMGFFSVEWIQNLKSSHICTVFSFFVVSGFLI